MAPKKEPNSLLAFGRIGATISTNYVLLTLVTALVHARGVTKITSIGKPLDFQVSSCMRLIIKTLPLSDYVRSRAGIARKEAQKNC